MINRKRLKSQESDKFHDEGISLDQDMERFFNRKLRNDPPDIIYYAPNPWGLPTTPQHVIDERKEKILNTKK